VTRLRLFWEKNNQGLLLRLTRWIVLPNFTFVALPVPEILAFIHSWDIRGTLKLWESRYQVTPLLGENNPGLLLRLTRWIVLPNFTFVALPVPEILGGTQKIGSHVTGPRPFLRKSNWVDLFSLSLWICAQNCVFVAVHIPEILRGTLKKIGSHVTGPRPFFGKNS